MKPMKRLTTLGQAFKGFASSRAGKAALMVAAMIGSALLAAGVRAYSHATMTAANSSEAAGSVSFPQVEEAARGQQLNPEGRRVNEEAGLPSSTPVEAAQVGGSPRIKAVYFRITPLGIEPAELTLPAGRYLVAIYNDSGFNEVDVKIDKEGGSRLRNAQLASGTRKWREYVDFTPGRHVLTDPTDTKRVCQLTITDQ